MVNGQTGKVGGKAPVSPWKVAIAVILGLVILGTVFYLLSQFGGNTDDGGYYYNSITAFLEKGF